MVNVICAKNSSDRSFSYTHKKDNNTENIKFKLHNHIGYEILVFLKGDADFIVEGNSYALKPMDIILTRNDEMHRILNTSHRTYERIVIHLQDSFFSDPMASQYTEIFLNRKAGESNLIERDAVKKSGIFDILLRIEKYVKEQNPQNELVIRCALTELLHQLNELKTSGGIVQNETVKNIIEYINSHLRDDLTLDSLAEKFYISKYYLCRCFKQFTGFTVNRYITHRRIMLVRELHREGKSLSAASSEAGFSNYSNFYKAYVNETGYPPSEGLSGNSR